MTKQRDPKHNKLRAKTPRRTTADHKKKAVKAAPITDRLNTKDREKPTYEHTRPPHVVRNSLGKVKQNQQINAKAEAAVSNTKEVPTSARLINAQQLLQTRRVSFIIRLTVGPGGEIGRTEIEDVSGGKKQYFPDFSPHEIGTFIKACISPETIPEEVLLETLPFGHMKASVSTAPEQNSSLLVFDAQVFHLGALDFMTLLLRAGEPFTIQSRFKVHGPTSLSIANKEANFGIKVYANEITSGRSKLLTIYTTELKTKTPGYEALVAVSGLPSGLYRLFILMTLGKPLQMVGLYDRIIIHVM